jgi:hypothetical protein
MLFRAFINGWREAGEAIVAHISPPQRLQRRVKAQGSSLPS